MFSTQNAIEKTRVVVNFLLLPISTKNLGLSARLISIYKLLIAHLIVFLLMLGVVHEEQVEYMLEYDIKDQKNNGYFNMAPQRNELSLRNAFQLVSFTEMLLYFFTGIASLYLLSAIFLFIGVFRNRAGFIIPWLIVEFIFIVAALVLILWFQDAKVVAAFGSKFQFFFLCLSSIFFNCLMWNVIHTHYRNLRCMDKLREIAVVAIPCPAPGAAPYHYRPENMYLGSNGYKHILTDSPDGYN